MYSLKIVDGYRPNMSVRETERAIKLVKDTFQRNFIANFGFERISAPLFVIAKTGINDDLNGVERPVRFDIKEQDGREVEIVHSLAKWKRMALHKYNFGVGEGLYTDMNAIRRDDSQDNTHSIYVDQWDWEMVISREQRNVAFLKDVVRRIVKAMCETLAVVKQSFNQITTTLNPEVTFITTQELLDAYPKLTAHERESAATKKYGTVFLMKIGDKLTSGESHDGRAPDYDDWSLNGDLLFWDEVLGESLEISSMGIRVDENSLPTQLQKANATSRLEFEYHKGIMNGTLPLTIGGGIGQSRLCMLLLGKMHIGEVQVSQWPEGMKEELKAHGLSLL